MEGDQKGGFSVFYADDGLDTGPVILQKTVDIEPNETVDTLYNRFLYPEGIKAMVFIFFGQIKSHVQILFWGVCGGVYKIIIRTVNVILSGKPKKL